MFQYLADLITNDLLLLEAGSRLGESVNFFFYDTFKILFLIFTVVTVIAFIRTFLSPSKFKAVMARSRFGAGNVAAATFGAVTPFCSCSSIPIFVGFLEARIPLGIAFSYLITSPLVNEVAFVIMGGLFGWTLAVVYAVSGILLGVFAGLILGRMKLENNLIFDGNCKKVADKVMPKSLPEKVRYALSEGRKTFRKLLPYVLGGVALGAVIHGYVPSEFFTNVIGGYSILSVPLAVLIGVPIYAGCSTIVPLIFAITQHGVPLGTSLAFMMAIASLSLPEALMLKSVMKFRLLAIFFGIVAVGIIVIGYLFNFLEGVVLLGK